MAFDARFAETDVPIDGNPTISSSRLIVGSTYSKRNIAPGVAPAFLPNPTGAPRVHIILVSRPFATGFCTNLYKAAPPRQDLAALKLELQMASYFRN
jgi:hypothetical protein